MPPLPLTVVREDTEQKRWWERLRDGKIQEAQKEDGPDLLEQILLRRGYASDRLGLLERIRKAMRLFWPDPGINIPLVAKKDITHNRRILFYLASILFPCRGELVKDTPETDPVPCTYSQLDEDDLFVLLCAVYLHDYAKGQFRLVVANLDSKSPHRNGFANAFMGTDLTPDQQVMLENYHSKSIVTFLGFFVDHRDRTLLTAALEKAYGRGSGLAPYWNAIGQPKLPPLEPNPEFDADSAQKHLFDLLWELSRATRPNGASLLREIQLISGAHKAYRFENGDVVDSYDELNREPATPGVNLLLLASLLRTADNLDMTCERLASHGALPNAFKTWFDGGARATISKPIQKIYFKWLTFSILQAIRIDHRKGPSGGGHRVIEITLQYERLLGWRDHLLTLRRLIEKDFIGHTAYLNGLCPDLGEKIELRLLYELVQPMEPAFSSDFKRRIVGYLARELQSRAADMAAARKSSRVPGHDYQNLPVGEALSFSPLVPARREDFSLPSHLDLLYLIVYLRTLGRAKPRTIATWLALPFANRLEGEAVAELCNDLPHGLLRVDEEGDVDFRDDDARERADELLKLYRQHSLLVREKVREIALYGEPLPFSVRETSTVPTGIDGLNKILNPLFAAADEHPGLQRCRTLLVVGGPGSGKTTLLAQILHWNSLHSQRRVVLLTFEELPNVLAEACDKNFGWHLDFIHNLQLGPTFDATLERIHQLAAGHQETPDLVAIDGLSRLHRHETPDQPLQLLVDRLFKTLMIRGITCIASLGEAAIEKATQTERYQADGVIHLFQQNAIRRLEIEKLRNQDHSPGRHAFEILDEERRRRESGAGNQSPVLKSGINVYPNELFYASVTAATHSWPRRSSPEPGSGAQAAADDYLLTGIPNLDALFPGAGGRSGYRRGETILVLGSPGAGKTLFGLHFLKAGHDRAPRPQAHPEPHVLWLSFEGPKSLLERSVESFDESAGFRQLLGSDRFLFKFVPFALISPESVLYYVAETVKDLHVDCLVVDSISELDEAFQDKVKFRQYMTTFIHALMPRQVTTMFLYRVPGFFRSARENESDISTLVDTIISIKTFDMKNQIRRGLFVLKSRSRELRSQLQTLDIDRRCGIQVSNKGWELEGLLSGETGNIHEPDVFLKHFYENPAEKAINAAMVAQFKERYSNKGRFTEVRKPAIYSEFWSFRGNYGAGHSNTRVASVSRYMVEAFRERNALHDLDDFFPASLKEKIAGDVRWRRYETERKTHDSVPLYTDIGVLLLRRDLAAQLVARHMVAGSHGTRRTAKAAIQTCSWESLERLAHQDPLPRAHLSWDSLKQFAAEVAGAVRPTDYPYLFALPDLNNVTEFMACFFEILWTKGGDVFRFPVFDSEPAHRLRFYKSYIFHNRHLWKELQRIVQPGETSPAPVLRLLPEHVVRARIAPLLRSLAPPSLPLAGDKEAPLNQQLAQLAQLIQSQVLDKREPPVVDQEDILTIGNCFGQEALQFLYDLVFDSAGAVPNPCAGDLRYAAVFSRRWYSQVQGVPAEVEARRKGDPHEGVSNSSPVTREHLVVLPLPSFSSPGIEPGSKLHRSCTCENVWCLCVVKEALSPEIAWIYIDSLTSRDSVEGRAKDRCGLPYRVDEMTSMERHDPPVYAMLDELMQNKRRKDMLYKAERRLLTEETMSESEIDQAVEAFLKGQWHLRDVREMIEAFKKRGDNPKIAKRQATFERQLALVNKGRLKKALDAERGRLISETANFEASKGAFEVPLRSRLPDHRPLFHRVESIVHDEIVTLFSPEGRRLWLERLGLEAEDNPAAVDKALSKNKRALIAQAVARMQDRLIFELLTGYPGERQLDDARS